MKYIFLGTIIKNRLLFSLTSLVILLIVAQPLQAQLRPVDDPLPTTTADSSSQFLSAEVCAGCHTTQFDQWRSSMMGYSSISPPIHALELSENHVMRGATPLQSEQPFGRLTRDPEAPTTGRYEENRLFCQKCHAPIAVFSDLFANVEDFNFTESNRGSFPDAHALLRQVAGLDARTNIAPGQIISADEEKNAFAAMEGVTCTVCHSINGRETNSSGPRNNFDVGVSNSGYRIHHSNTADLNAINFYGPLQIAAAPHGTGHNTESIVGNDGISRPLIRSGEFCGTCHDVRIPAPDALVKAADGSQESFRRVENLFTEWRNSPWNNNNIMMGNPIENPSPLIAGSTTKEITTCQDCHMSKFMTEPDAPPGKYEKMGLVSDRSTERGRISNHRFIGVDRFLVHNSPFDTSRALRATDLADYDISEIDANALVSKFPDIPASSLNFDQGKADAREILLQKAIDFKIVSSDVNPQSNLLSVKISVENVGAGHNIPAGLSQERQVWIELEVLNNRQEHIYTSGYLTPFERPEDDLFEPEGAIRYKDSYCGADNGKHEYECDLDSFRAKLNEDFTIVSGTLKDGDDVNRRNKTGVEKENRGLVNYQNGFTKDGEKVLTQFIADSIDNSNSLEPFRRRIEQYDISVNPEDGPFTVNARLRFRPLPHEFLANLKRLSSARVTDAVIKRNKVIEMEQDSCATGNVGAGLPGLRLLRPCNSVNPIAFGNAYSCTLSPSDSGAVYCYGKNEQAQLGLGYIGSAQGPNSPNYVLSPTAVPGLFGVKQLALGEQHSCALRYNGSVSCWGRGDRGLLGDNDVSTHYGLTPQQIDTAELSNVSSISSTGYTTCAIVESFDEAGSPNTVKCWGSGEGGTLGDGDIAVHNASLPIQIDPDLLSGVQALSTGRSGRFCAVLDNGTVKCWGDNAGGSIGNGNTQDTGIPAEVQGLPYKASMVNTTRFNTCTLLVNGDVYCWGDNFNGSLGDGAEQDSLVPVKTRLSQKAVSIVGGNCALMEDATVECWGSGVLGALGNGTLINAPTPQTVPGLNNVVSISGDGIGTCASFENNYRQCWGLNHIGQLGFGNKQFIIGTPTGIPQPGPTEDAEIATLNPEFFNMGDVRWTRRSGSTPSNGTGPSGGANGSDFYYYMETSVGSANAAGQTSILETGFFDALFLENRVADLSFDYHMYGSDVGTLAVDALVLGEWQQIWSANGDQGNQWLGATTALTGLPLEGKIKIRFRAQAIGGFRGDIAIDNIQFNF